MINNVQSKISMEKMKNIKYLAIILPLAMLALGSCSKMDDYLKYTDGKELLYTGRVDSLVAHSGINRVVLRGLLISDPKITKVKIYWNLRQDSLIVDITRGPGVDKLDVPIPLAPGNYNFEVKTYDAVGNSSVTVLASGTSYGTSYQESVQNRPIKRAEKVGSEVTVDFFSGSDNSPYSKLTYIGTDNKEHTLKVTNDLPTVKLTNYKSATKFKLQSVFLPDTMAVDTFYAAIQEIGVAEDVTNAYLKNAGAPILRGDTETGKWGTPRDWQFNSAATNQNNGRGGGWSTDNGGVIHFETKDWGGEGVNNGKVWQTVLLPAGNYTVSFETGSYGGDVYTVEEMVASGTNLPNIGTSTNVLAVFHGNKNNLSGNHDVKFELTVPTTVSIGWVVSTGQYVYLQFKSIRLRTTASGF
ncbi:DUF5013 domain-containing protein [Pedobacter hiemivivus]|uniref:DUF5013 domain-containing protein n=2 Tax=Pedobacter hiemivivus TaxID=2530454 RepID=A0A4U1GD65_9SPHI|nr:DUF5013 domain-containing protein [Pedobacter hiemivivus]